jgi:peptide/nickel transport system substrate-binding protein
VWVNNPKEGKVKKVSRREFLYAGALSAAGAAIAACQPQTVVVKETVEVEKVVKETVEVEKEVVKEVAVASSRQAPEFQEMEAAGTLPPVQERTPLEPLVVAPIEEIGEYGGTLHTVTIRVEGYGDDTILMGCDGLLITVKDIKGLPPAGCAPNIANNWQFTEEGKVFTLYLREGLKWSDGEPFTADDLMFWYEAVQMNEEITPVIGSRWKPGGEPTKLEKVDDYTVKFISVVPNPLIVTFGGGPIRGDTQRSYPRHYMEQFHIEYGDKDQIMAEAAEAGYEFWYQYFNYKCARIWGTQLRPECPNLGAYLITSQDTSRRTYTRNPYYWKIDSEGNQLPYFKDVIGTIVENREMVNAQIVAGQVDLCIFEPMMENHPLYQENAEQGEYHLDIWHSVLGSDVIYQPAMTYKEDTVLRDIFRDVRFRQALSLAINREEVNEVVYFGYGTPTQWTVHPICTHYKEEYARSYAEYDRDRANALLDEMGLEWDSDHQFRTRPDGQKLGWTIEFFPVETPKSAITEMVVDYWREIGCDVQSKEITGELDSERYQANLVEMGLWHGDKVTDVLFAGSPQFLVPYSVGWETTWGTEWARWYRTDGEEGEEPPPEILELYDAWEALGEVFDEAERKRLGAIILESQAKNLWCIGTVGSCPHPIIEKDNVGNFPEDAWHGWDVVWSNYLHPQQFFFKGGVSLIDA